MLPEETADMLDALAAEALAMDVAAPEAVTQMPARLAEAQKALDPQTPAAQAVSLVVEALQVATVQASADDCGLGNAVATALARAAELCRDPEAVLDPEADQARQQLELFLAGGPLRSPDTAAGESTPEAETFFITEGDGSAEVDLDLLAEFMAEANDHIAAAEASLLRLEESPDDSECIHTILRAFHTLKGASAFLGLASLQKLAHAAESMLSLARDGSLRIAGPHADLTLRACDALKQMIQSLGAYENGQTPSDPPGLAELVDSLTHPDVSDQPPQAVTQEPAGQSDASGAVEASAQAMVDTTVRVSTDRLNDLIDMVGELVIAQSMNSQAATSGSVHEVNRTDKIVRELQDLAMSLRMVPLKGTFSKMARIVRDVAHESGKDVQLACTGDQTEIDRNMVESLTDPLIHMLRNAVDHGIETPPQRQEAGKPATATICLHAFHSAGNVVIEVSDDGRGIDVEKVHARAVQLGLADAGRDVSQDQALSMIFHPGFSTAQRVTSVSGRGVGMDIVKRNVSALNGRIKVSSELGSGTVFSIRLPLTMAITDAMLVRVARERYLLPTIGIERCFVPPAGSVTTIAGRREIVEFYGKSLPIVRLHELFNIDQARTDPTEALMVVVAGSSGQPVALMVDEILGHQQAVIKSLGKGLQRQPGMAGGAILGDGCVGLILDIDGLADAANEDRAGRTAARPAA